jgi:hypothetical protein
VPFKPGQGGRPKGVKNKATRKAEAICQRMVDDREYRREFARRFKAGELPPPLEAMVWHYAFGKPTEHHILNGDEDGGPVLVKFVDVA